MVKSAKLIRWVARIWSLVSLAFVLIFLIGYSVSPTERLPQGVEWLIMGFFPIGVVVFMLLAWKWEKWGGILAIICFVTFYIAIYIQKGIIVRGPFVFLVAAPGFLFLISWLLGNKSKAYEKSESERVSKDM